MKAKYNKILGLVFITVVLAMAIFNACSKYDRTYAIDDSKCALCLSCITVCGQHAISLDTSGSTKRVVIDKNKCIGCGRCYNACKYNAISSN